VVCQGIATIIILVGKWLSDKITTTAKATPKLQMEWMKVGNMNEMLGKIPFFVLMKLMLGRPLHCSS
jgi:hypothetical protein